MTIRTAAAADVDGIVEAFEWLFAPPGSTPEDWDPPDAAERARALIASDDGEILLAVTEQGIAGFCTVALDLVSIRFGSRAWVEDLAVDPAQRSTGVGKRLLDAAKDWARERGATHLELDSAHARTDAHRFYERERPSWSSISFG